MKWKKRKTAVAAACAAALAVIGMTVFAAVKFDWTEGIALILHSSEEDEQTIENSLVSSPDVSAEQNGITIRPVQVLADRAVAVIALEISGDGLPKDRLINQFGNVTVQVGGKRMAASYMAYAINQKGEAEKNSFLQKDEDNTLEVDLLAIPYTIDPATVASIKESEGWEPLTEEGILGQEIVVSVTDLGYSDPVGQFQTVTEGTWTLSWTLTGDDTVREIPVDIPFETPEQAGKVTKVTLSPLYMTVEMDWKALLLTEEDGMLMPDGSTEDYHYWAEPPMITGFVMKNGRIYTDVTQSFCNTSFDREAGIYTYHISLSRLVDVDEIEAITLAGGVTVPLGTE